MDIVACAIVQLYVDVWIVKKKLIENIQNTCTCTFMYIGRKSLRCWSHPRVEKLVEHLYNCWKTMVTDALEKYGHGFYNSYTGTFFWFCAHTDTHINKLHVPGLFVHVLQHINVNSSLISSHAPSVHIHVCIYKLWMVHKAT